MKKRLLALLLCVTLVLALAGCTSAKKDEGDTVAKKEEVGAVFTLKVVHGGGAEATFQVTTEKETVGEALEDEGLIAGEIGAYGLYVKTVDGETVDDAKEQWWCLTKGGQQLNTGVDTTPVEDGATYEFTFTEGY